GMLLSPQHLQQWDRHLEHLLGSRFRSAQAFDWGLTVLAIDRTALANGRLQVESIAGVLPDGTPFAAPEHERLPAPREIRPHFGEQSDTVRIEIGLPKARPRRPSVGPAAEPGAPGPRFSGTASAMPDDHDGSNDREIEVAELNLCLLFPDESLGDHDHVPIAEIGRTPSGGFALRDTFLPSRLTIAAPGPLMEMLPAHPDERR